MSEITMQYLIIYVSYMYVPESPHTHTTTYNNYDNHRSRYFVSLECTRACIIITPSQQQAT